MLPKASRLPVGETRTEGGRTYRSPLFALKVLPPRTERSRFGVVIGKRVDKTASGRNALRRKFFDAAESASATWPAADYLIVVRPGAAAATKEQLYEQLISFDPS